MYIWFYKLVIVMKCQNSGCKLSAKFNVIGSENPLVCYKHQKDGMIRIRNNTCRYCTKTATFGFTCGKPLSCKDHKKPDMINVKDKTCKDPECKKIPIYNFAGESKGIYCYDHKKPDMFNVKDKKCRHPECKKLPTYNFAGECKGIYCYTHRKPEMVNVISKRCQHSECKKHPMYNFEGESKGIYCYTHKKPDMIDVKSKRCKYPECKKRPTYNFAGESKGIYCYTHKKPEMIDVLHKRCKTPLCDIRIGNKYQGYCFRCFIHMFPDSPLTRNYKSKERYVTTRVQEWITTNYPDIRITFDRKINGGCSLRRPDMFIELLTHVVTIEVDENQHKRTSCETLRLVQLFEDVAQRPCVFIRFNPDAYVDSNGKRHKSCFKYTENGICVIDSDKEMTRRLIPVFESLRKYLNEPQEKMIQVEEYWYNEMES